MNATRFLLHVFATRWTTRRCFGPQVLAAIEMAIRETEASHAGEIRFAVETALDMAELVEDLAPRRRAMQVFGQLGVWDTANNNGVLIYLLLAEHAIEFVADRALSAHVDHAQWQAIVDRLGARLRSGEFEDGLTQALEEVSALLVAHFPTGDDGVSPNELPDSVVRA